MFKVTRIVFKKHKKKLKKNCSDSDKPIEKKYIFDSSFDSDSDSNDEDENVDIKNNKDYFKVHAPRKDIYNRERRPY